MSSRPVVESKGTYDALKAKVSRGHGGEACRLGTPHAEVVRQTLYYRGTRRYLKPMAKDLILRDVLQF